MSSETLSQEKLDAGKACLDLLDEYGLGVQGAVWIYINTLKEWRFYIVTTLVEIDGIVATYNRIEKLFLFKFHNAELTIDDVHLGSPNEPLFSALSQAISVQGRSPIVLKNCVVNNIEIEHAYIYRLDKALPLVKARQARHQFDKKLKQLERMTSE